jgi:hypothetical protein
MKGMRDGYRNECKACNLAQRAAKYRENPEPTKARVRKWQADNPERVKAKLREYRDSGRRQANDRRTHLKRKYGITPEQYEEMLAAQGGGCAICQRPPREDISLHVDHDHETGTVRGLLCFRCNNALGDFDDDVVLMQMAAAYLDRHDPETIELTALVKARTLALVGR